MVRIIRKIRTIKRMVKNNDDKNMRMIKDNNN